MTAVEVAGVVLTAFSAALFVPSIIQRRRNRRRLRAWLLEDLRAQLARTKAERDHYRGMYHGAVRVNAAYLEHITDERRAAAYQALTDAPLFFDTAARQSLDWLDTETEWSE